MPNVFKKQNFGKIIKILHGCVLQVIEMASNLVSHLGNTCGNLANTLPTELLHIVVSNICKVQRVDLTCDVIRKVAPFVLSKL